MAVLTKNEILKEIRQGKIKITPFNATNIGPASIDLTLDNEFRIFSKGKRVVLDEKTDYKKLTNFKKINQIVLKPGEFAIGITKEQVKLPEDVCGWLTGRSRFARLGLLVHITAAFIQPGINNKQVLEMRNVSPNDLVVKTGTKVCQLVIERTEGKAKYKGKFSKQKL
ncbi:dCTP deaminase [Candidatus Woesearchaeota archaeon]|nr:dCTP deaminase [Candidatus Woesearchaeota archaeon]